MCFSLAFVQTPFLKDASSLSEDVRVVLPEASMLEDYLTELYYSACHENGLNLLSGEEFVPYQVCFNLELGELSC